MTPDDLDARTINRINRVNTIFDRTLDAYTTLAHAAQDVVAQLDDGEPRDKLLRALEETTRLLNLAISPAGTTPAKDTR